MNQKKHRLQTIHEREKDERKKKTKLFKTVEEHIFQLCKKRLNGNITIVCQVR